MPEVVAELSEELVTMTPSEAESYIRDLRGARPDLAARVVHRCGQLLARQSQIGTRDRPPATPALSTTGDLAGSSSESTLIDDLPLLLGDGRYEVVAEIGRGGFGVVYRGRDRRTGQAVALKTMRQHGGRALEFFKGEFRYLQGIAHPNLVQLLGLSSEGDDWLIAMEYVPGIDFLSYVRPAETDFERLREALGQLVEGIAALHRHRRLHRDLKPQNIRVTPGGRVVVLDFGLAAESGADGELRYVDANTPGTVPYMAPEQFDDPPVSSTASDLYSIGVVLYLALTGETPFAGSLRDVVREKRTRDPVLPRDLPADVPDDLQILCLALLARRPAERPGAEAVLRSLGREAATLPDATEEAAFLGRDRHLEELSAAYEASRDGRAVAVRIQGPSGIGKSALVGQFVDRVRSQGAVVLAGRCYEHESVPYKALDPIVDELARYLGSLPEDAAADLVPSEAGPLVKVFPVLARVGAIGSAAKGVPLSPDVHEVRRRAFAGLRELLGKLAATVPLVVHIDDLQWGDIDSAYLLTDLLVPPGAPGITWLLAHRSEDAAAPCLVSFAESLARVGVAVRELRVDPLTAGEIREMVVRQLGREFEGRSERIAVESGGNPYFVRELIHSAQTGHGTGSESGQSLDGLIRERVARLPEGSRRLLELVAVSGRPLGDTDAYRAAEGVEDARTLAARLEAGRLLRGVGESGELKLETYHDRVREAILAGLPGDRRRHLHGRLATVLEASGRGEPEELAQHFEGAGEDGKAGTYYALSADRAHAALAFDGAAEFYRKALDLGRLEPAGQNAMRRKLADALADAGRGAEAGPVYRDLANVNVGNEETELRRRAMNQLLSSGHTDEGMQELTRLFDRFGVRLPRGHRRAKFRMILAIVRLKLRGTKYRERPTESIPPELLLKIDTAYTSNFALVYIEPALSYWMKANVDRWSLDAGEPKRVAEALASVAFLSATEGLAGYRRSAALFGLAEGLNARTNDLHRSANRVLYEGSAHWLSGYWEKVLASLQECERIVKAGQVPFEEFKTHLRHLRLDALMMMGRWREYAELVGPYLEDARRKGNRFAVSAMSIHSALPALVAGRLDRFAESLQEGWDAWPQKGNVMGGFWGLYWRIEGALYRADGAAAVEQLRRDEREMGSHTLYKIFPCLNLTMLHTKGRAALAAARDLPRGGFFGRRAGLLRSASRNARKIEKARMPWSNPLATLLRAGVANRRGNADEALRLIVAAEEGFEAADMRMYVAAARRQRGRLLGGDAGRELVRAADQFMTGEGVREPDRIAAVLVPGFPA